MAANTAPIYSRLSDVQWIVASISNTTKDLTSGTIYLVWTADSTNGGFLDQVVFQPFGTNTASVARVWLNNGSATGTAANNTMLKDVTLAATTNSETAQIGQTSVTIGAAIPASYRVYVTLGTGVAAGFHIYAIAGKY